jgi:Recombination endonuclease VII
MGAGEKPDYGPQNRGLKGQWGKWKGCICVAEGCDEPVSCRGLCRSHYQKKKWADGHRAPSINPTERRNRHLKHRYGITSKEYDARFAAQGGVCAICKQPPGDNVRAHWGAKLCIDHCHDTGTVRGLLCNDCNLAIGYAKTEATALAMVGYFRLYDGKGR